MDLLTRARCKPGPAFVAEMARAVHEARKSQTRRVIEFDADVPMRLASSSLVEHRGRLGVWFDDGETAADAFDRVFVPAPYVPGETYYLREPVKRGRGYLDADLEGEAFVTLYPVVYACDGAEHPDAIWVWKPSGLPGRYMARGLARAWVRIEDVRVERLQAITNEDALAEGVTGHAPRDTSPEELESACSPREEFRELWDTINGKRAPWEASPWVWVVGFSLVIS